MEINLFAYIEVPATPMLCRMLHFWMLIIPNIPFEKLVWLAGATTLKLYSGIHEFSCMEELICNILS